MFSSNDSLILEKYLGSDNIIFLYLFSLRVLKIVNRIAKLADV